MSIYETHGQETSGIERPTTADDDELTIADTDEGMLAFDVEYRPHLGREVEVARELIGFVDVSDWKAIAEALQARGLGVRATTSLPVFDSVDEIEVA